MIPALRPVAIVGIACLVAAQAAGGGDAKALARVLIEGGAAERRAAATQLEKMGAKGAEAIPQLLRAFRYDADLDVRRGVSRALAAIDPSNPKILAAFRDGLVDPKTAVRVIAANALSKLGGTAWTTIDPLLRRAAKDNDEAVRAAALAAASAICQQKEEALWQIVERLASPDEKLQIAACGALAGAGRSAAAALPHVVHLRESASGQRIEVFEAAERALAAIDPARASKGSSGRKPKDPTLDVTPAMAELLKLMTSDSPRVRKTAVDEVAKLRDQAQPAILRLGKLVSEDGDEEVAAAAARALGAIGPPAARVLLALRNALTEGGPDLRRESAVAIGKIGPGAVGAVGDLARMWITDGEPGIRRDAAGALRKLQVSRGDLASALGDELATEDPAVRLRACYAIAELGSTGKANDAVVALERALGDDVTSVRCAAAFSLGSLAAPLDSTQSALARAMADGDESVRKSAGDALRRIDPKAFDAALAAASASRPAEPPPPPAPDPNAPKPNESRPARDPAALRSAVADLIRGEGGATNPSFAMDGSRVTVLLRLAHVRFDESDAHRDAVWLSLKLLSELPELGSVEVRVLSSSAKPLSANTVTLERARTFFERLDDPFERRRIQDWWPALIDR